MLIYGVELGPTSVVTLQWGDTGLAATRLGGTRVLIDGVAAPLVYTFSQVLSAVVPYGAQGKSSVSVQVDVNGKLTNTITLPVAAAAPGIFSLNQSGTGPGAILNWPD